MSIIEVNSGLVEDIAGLARTECTLILTSSRPELYDVGSHRKKNIVREYKVILNAIISVAVHPTVSTKETICLFWSPEPDFGQNWSWWYQSTNWLMAQPALTFYKPWVHIVYKIEIHYTNIFKQAFLCILYTETITEWNLTPLWWRYIRKVE